MEMNQVMVLFSFSAALTHSIVCAMQVLLPRRLNPPFPHPSPPPFPPRASSSNPRAADTDSPIVIEKINRWWKKARARRHRTMCLSSAAGSSTRGFHHPSLGKDEWDGTDCGCVKRLNESKHLTLTHESPSWSIHQSRPSHESEVVHHPRLGAHVNQTWSVRDSGCFYIYMCVYVFTHIHTHTHIFWAML